MKTKTGIPQQIQLGVPASGDVYAYAQIFPRGTTVNDKGMQNLARINGLPDGTMTQCDAYAKRDADASIALDFAEELVGRYNRYEALLAALELATATLELHTGNGAKSQPKSWAKFQLPGDQGVDIAKVAKHVREVLTRKGRDPKSAL